MSDLENLRQQLAEHVDRNSDEYDDQTPLVFRRFLDALTAGQLRAANPSKESDSEDSSSENSADWEVDFLVKKGILLGFRLGKWKHFPGEVLEFSDKDTYALRPLPLQSRNIRIVPGGSSVRAGAYLGHNVTMMPPAYVNVGAYVDDGTMVDSHALVGSCAQIGKNVHLSAGCQIGGVLEPIGQLPVIVEDNVFVGGNTGIYEGTQVRKNAVIAAGTILTRGTRVYDLVNDTIHSATEDSPLVIPERAVVVPGSRPASGDFAKEHGVQLYVPVIVKYRDEKTSASTTLEDALR